MSLAGLAHLFGSTTGSITAAADAVNVYMPTSPFHRVISVEMESGRPMQSAAKCPFLLTFRVSPFGGPDSILRRMLKKQAKLRKTVCAVLGCIGYPDDSDHTTFTVMMFIIIDDDR